jgi:hypothetical protein
MEIYIFSLLIILIFYETGFEGIPIVVGQLMCFTLMEETQVAEPRWIKKLLSLVFHMITAYTSNILKMMCLSLLGNF